MKRRIINGVQIVVTLIMIAFMKIPNITLKSGLLGKLSEMDLIKGAVFDRPISINYYFTVAIIVLVLLACLISIAVKKRSKDSKIHIILSLIMFINTFYNTILFVGNNENESANLFLIWGIVALSFIVLVLSIIKRSPAIVGAIEVEDVSKKTTNADELKKFKDLLDNGAITQEEFDAKKKELLDL